ncbi:MAG: polymer-forming cytoskeletal protein [Thermoanaerobaculales bacterium]|jgi:cytoskeletal protein CcmA (bactofilin family)|nr:polymer-forming cytoskeletal protein [Thermoanaerobaculales bacterium]
MWKKDDEPRPPTTATPPTGVVQTPERPRPAPSPRGEQATIGRSITIRGDVTGDEDLVIQGRVEGTIDLQQHNVTVGPDGRVKANVAGRTVTIEGEVDGDVRGAEQVVLRAGSRVHGDIVAPRVALEDGASFLGSIDMSGAKTAGAAAKPSVAQPAGPRVDAAKA